MEKEYWEALSLLDVVHPDSICLHKTVLPFLVHVISLPLNESESRVLGAPRF